MDSHRFDALSRSLATAGTRRRLMRLLGALPLVGTLAAVFAGNAMALGRNTYSSHPHGLAGAAHAEHKRDKREKRKKRKKRKPRLSVCPEGRKACRGGCIPSNQCCISSDCPVAVPVCCGGECVADLISNARHCSTCATDCMALANAARSTCSAGTCVLVCDSDYANCNTDVSDGCEINTQTDPTHCGICGNVCSASTPSCVGGLCVA